MGFAARMLGKWAVIVLAAFVLAFGWTGQAFADSTTDVEVEVTYGQTEARSMLSSINDFRTGSDAWYWNSDDTTKTTCSGLSKLTYDYTLEKIAMQRAAEIALSLSHTRPDGTNCKTAYTTGTWTAWGENIAAGTGDAMDTANEAFVSWQETNENYSGQGHRRNMLSSNYNAIGIGHVVYNGVHYWVQEFGKTSSVDTTATTASDLKQTVTVSIADTQISSTTVSASPSSLSVEFGQNASLPTLTKKIELKKAWPSGTTVSSTVTGTWSSDDASVASISGSNVVGESVGSTTLTATASGQTVNVSVTVTQASISEATVTLSPTSTTYTGSKITPTATVTLNGKTLTQDTDYTVSYSNNVNVGTATATVTGKGNYTGTASTTFTISAASIASASVGSIANQTYTGSAIEPTVAVTLDGTALTRDTDYTVSYSDNVNAGTATATITGKGNYTGTVKTTFTISKAKISVPTAKLGLVYTGEEQTGVAPGTGYTLSGTVTATDAGSYTAMATPDPNHTWSDGTASAKTISWSIAKAQNAVTGLTCADVEMGDAPAPSASAASGTVSYTYATSESGTYGEWSTSNGVGTYYVKASVDASTNYEAAEATASFKVTAKSLAAATVKLGATSATYTGSAIEPTATVTLGDKTLTQGTDYTVSYSNNVNAGTATATVTGKGNYTGTASVTFTISKATPTYTAPKANTPTYTGKAQVLVSAGSTSNGTVYYKLGASGTYSTSVPTATDAGTYTVYWKLVGDANHSDIAEQSITVSLGKASGQTASASVSVRYDNTATQSVSIKDAIAQFLASSDAPSYGAPRITSGADKISGTPSVDASGTLTFALASGLAARADNTAMSVEVTGLKNYEKVTVTVNIAITEKIAVTVDMGGITLAGKTYDGKTLSYTGSANGTANGGAYSGGFDYVWYDSEGNALSAAPKNAGTYTLKATVSDADYVGEGTKSVTIAQAHITVTATDKSATVGDEAPDLTNPVLGTDYTVAGLADGESLKTTPTLSYAIEPNMTTTGSVLIRISGAEVPDGGNYESKITYVNGGLTINDATVATQAMYRLYNPNSGEHFYTANAGEKDNLVSVGWNYEGIGWTAPVSSSTPVYRMYNPNPSPKTGSGEHHYTTSTAERDMLVNAGWSYEGIGWYSDDAKSVPLYRVYNPNEFNNNHHYTTSKDERDYLLSIGWNDEGIAWYGV